jgi:hypothetical protein
MAVRAAVPSRVFKVAESRVLRVEATDSLGVAVAVISDGVESVVVPSVAIAGLIAQLRRAEVALDLAVTPGVVSGR